MANFQTHLTVSTILGIGYGGAAYAVYDLPASSCLVAAGFCSLSGMLPDIDSGPGRPLQEITTFMAAVIPAMALGIFRRFGLAQETIILTGAVIYAAIRFGLADFLRHYTVHRGMFHSFVTAAIFGELAYLLLNGSSEAIRIFISIGVVLGFLSHLVLDEIYSVEWDGVLRTKKSAGTAMKFFGKGWWPNITAYGKFAILTFLIVNPGAVKQTLQDVARDFRSSRAAIRAAANGMQAMPNSPSPQNFYTNQAQVAQNQQMLPLAPSTSWSYAPPQPLQQQMPLPTPASTQNAPVFLADQSQQMPPYQPISPPAQNFSYGQAGQSQQMLPSAPNASFQNQPMQPPAQNFYYNQADPGQSVNRMVPISY